MFYTFDQNNSGGSFVLDKKNGITHFVIVEADNASDADDRLEDIGGYFDGCHTGMDCPCCGDRWYRQWKDDGTEKPELYGQPVERYGKGNDWTIQWMEDGYEIAVHYKDGRIEWHGVHTAQKST